MNQEDIRSLAFTVGLALVERAAAAQAQTVEIDRDALDALGRTFCILYLNAHVQALPPEQRAGMRLLWKAFFEQALEAQWEWGETPDDLPGCAVAYADGVLAEALPHTARAFAASQREAEEILRVRELFASAAAVPETPGDGTTPGLDLRDALDVEVWGAEP